MRVGIGPVNTAGQAYRLAVALRRAGIAAESFASKPHPYGFPVDHIAGTSFVQDCTHVLSWTGVKLPHHNIGYVYCGSELRRPSVHRRLERWSPFDRGPFTRALETRIRPLRHPAFVQTLDLLDFAPDATWLPVIADPAESGPLFAGDRLRVLFAPTRTFLKGDVPEDPAYDLVRPEHLSPDAMLAAIGAVDVVVGGLVLGGYGVTETEAMAAGRLVVGNVNVRVRALLPDLPIVQATPDGIVDVLRDIAADPERYRPVAARGPAFHAHYHDGRYSVGALGDFLSVGEVAA